ncbi:MAG: flagellar basal body rod protein FlgC, partial [Candidatus Hydrogenedentes bacterium]|nr:flagellar basal body rod protein FlgC [Candidatus Hydrogenedentota bacterium]
PTHPDANADGIVAYPNINLSVEMINLISAQRGYEANIDVILSSRRMTQKALEIIQQ